MDNRILKWLRLIFIVSIIVAIAFFIANKGLELLEKKKYEDIKTDLLLVQAKIKLTKGKATVNNTNDNYVGSCVSECDNNEIKDFLKWLNINEEDFDKYYVLNYPDFEKLGISQDLKNKEENNIIVNYDTSEVLYKKGINVDGVTKHKLSEIVEKENNN